MAKSIIFQDAFLVAGIMCHGGCGNRLELAVEDVVDQLKVERILSADCHLQLDAAPAAPGIQQLYLALEGDESPGLSPESVERIKRAFRLALTEADFEVTDDLQTDKQESEGARPWINIAVNLLALAAITGLSMLFPPSIPLTLSLAAIALGATAFTARDYLRSFVDNLRHRSFAIMPATISMGWLLSLGHILYHSLLMPLSTGFSMVFMNFMMPVSLMTGINIMDEIQRLILRKSRKMHLQGLNHLFPNLAEDYPCYSLGADEAANLASLIKAKESTALADWQWPVQAEDGIKTNRKLLRQGMLIQVGRGECFPVDSVLLRGTTTVDAALLNGESRESKSLLDEIPAGAINLGNPVLVYATANAYHSTVNRLLFRANRAKKARPLDADNRLLYLYLGLTLLTLVVALVMPMALGIFALPLLIQNAMSLFFGLCPCMIALAQQLPALLSLHQRGRRGIVLRENGLLAPATAIHTVVFDKTGTLTTGRCQVASITGLSPALVDRVYLLEKAQGAAHPIAEGIVNYCESLGQGRPIIQDVHESTYDPANRGLTGLVQGQRLHIGNADYLRASGIPLPDAWDPKAGQGYTAVCVAENNQFKGIIYIKHEIRPGIVDSLKRLKQAGIRIILLTGDSKDAALAFNQQQGHLFAAEDIHAAQTPQMKEQFLSKQMDGKQGDAAGIWFVGDGLNDAPCARKVSELGGISCAMTAEDKSAFFSDIRLDGSLDYLFAHQHLNQDLRQNARQNQGLMIFGSLMMLVFVINFSLMGLALPPFIPVLAMLTTSSLVLFNAYRSRLTVDVQLDKQPSWFSRKLASNWPTGLLLAALSILVVGLVLSTIASGGLALPVIAFSAGILTAVSSGCFLGAGILLAAFGCLAGGYLLEQPIKIVLPSQGVLDKMSVSAAAVPSQTGVPFEAVPSVDTRAPSTYDSSIPSVPQIRLT